MKKRTVILWILVAVAALSLAACAAEEEVLVCGDFSYALLENGDAELIAYLGKAGDVLIPAELDGYPVMAVRRNPFLEISQSGYPLGSTYSESLKHCRFSVPEDHPYLYIVDGVLFGKTDGCLICCQFDTRGKYTVPDGVTRIGDYAFAGCKDITGVSFPDSLIQIGRCAFCSTGLTRATLPDSVTEIGRGAFSYCNKLTDVTIPDSVTVLSEEVFSMCERLSGVVLPDSVTRIEPFALSGCVSLREITIPESVTGIEDGAFHSSGLTRITIPTGVTSMGYGLFDDCSKLPAIDVAPDNPAFKSVDGVVYSKSGDAILFYPPAKRGRSVTIPDGVKRIGANAFYSCRHITSVRIPEGVTVIGFAAFAGSSNLKEVCLPDSLEVIESDAFAGCGLTKVTLPKSLTRVEEGILQSNELTVVVIPDNVTSIGSFVFAGCYGLTSVVIPDSVTDIHDLAFDECGTKLVLTVMPGSYAETWCREHGKRYVYGE